MRGEVKQGKARHFKVRQGKERENKARQGMANEEADAKESAAASEVTDEHFFFF
jgi:hypothetical protein